MRKSFILLTLIIFFSQVSSGQEKKVYENGYFIKIGDTSPDFIVRETGGKSYRLSDLKGKVVMLQFTASWCSVCRTEMPFIEKDIWMKGKDKGLIVLGIDRDEPIEKVIRFQRDIKVTYPLTLDPGADIFGLFAQKEAGVTRNVIIDRKGRIIYLTRLYKQEEFNEMKKLIFNELEAK